MPIFPPLLLAEAIVSWRDRASAAAAVLAAGSILLGLWNCRRAFAATTLFSAACWSAAAAVAIGGVELARGVVFLPGGLLSPLRFCAASLSLCPVVSVLGSKRPQQVAWNFVVLALWGIVSLHALTALAMQRTDNYVLGDARAWLLWVLILLELANYLPTRNWPSALLFAGAQILLFSSHLPLLRGTFEDFASAPSFSLVAFAAALAFACGTARGAAPHLPVQSFNRLWLDFRDQFGLLWGLRLQERVNAAAAAAKWGVELHWNGFHPHEISDEHREPLRQAMTGLLRRFVSHQWIASRLGTGVN